MKANAIYARYSSHAQDDGTSIDVQIEHCERAAGGPCTHYIDRAKSGRAMGGRTQLLAMLADADAGKLARVYVYKFDRLGRSADTHIIAQQLEDAGVELISATEGTNQLARGVQLVVAQDFSRQLATRTRDGLLKRFEQAGFTGGVAPYGYRVVERDGRRVLVIDDAEAGNVREVVRWYLTESVGFKSIAKRMRERGITSRRGAGWSFTSVRSMLLNPILAGRVRYNARRMHLDRASGRRVPRMKPTAEHMERHEPRRSRSSRRKPSLSYRRCSRTTIGGKACDRIAASRRSPDWSTVPPATSATGRPARTPRAAITTMSARATSGMMTARTASACARIGLWRSSGRTLNGCSTTPNRSSPGRSKSPRQRRGRTATRPGGSRPNLPRWTHGRPGRSPC